MSRLKIAFAVAVTALLTGCSGVSFTVDTLLTAPKLTGEQSEIHSALIASVGSNITLKYPKNGGNRSAFVIANIDGEENNEALVFYKYNSGSAKDEGLRVNLLDTDEEGNWYSVKDLEVAGSEVDRVIISPVGNYQKQNVLVGYQNLGTEEKTLEVYDYNSGDFKQVGLDAYSVLETLDIDGDHSNEIITIKSSVNAETGAITAQASMLVMKDGEVVRDEGIPMCSNIVSYTSAKTGYLNAEHKGIFVDGLTADGNLQTEIVYYRYSSLQNPMQLRSEKLLPLCTRPVDYPCRDMDGDSIVEIPSVSLMTGYENAVADEMVYMTSWNVYEDFYNLTSKYKGYYSLSDGYFLCFPTRWQGRVTVKRDPDTEELVFYKYEGDINRSNTEIMRIAVSEKSESENFEYGGYRLIESKGQLDYYVKFPENTEEQLILTFDEVENNFYIMD